MDFIFAAFPWFITWNLDMRKVEKVGLCFTMSLVSNPPFCSYRQKDVR